TDALCGSAFGTITIDSVQQGVAPFQYAVNDYNYNSGNIFNNIPQGNAIVLAKDAFNCFITDSTVIQATEALKIKIAPGDTTVCVADKVNLYVSLLSPNNDVK